MTIKKTETKKTKSAEVLKKEKTPVKKATKSLVVPVKVVKKEKKSAEVLKKENAVEKPVVQTLGKKKKVAKPTASVGTFKLKGKDAELLTKYQHNTSDTGSTEVQVALFTAKINSLAKHLKKHGKDSDSKRGLIIMVGKRRRLLNYLLKHNQAQYQKLIADLGLRK
ncbi:30S ribosomal protein S15 [Candidatus Berkelbacteria bacterium CG10_big_fil_rev_8_21_14_0_10_43_14]|uniref:Small ribosomal subunit protein uS15 n=1 Tax=Candidatus Berkelbacteria bacterium CG10_big_fil_rev_8_21_14_0_10_43_14 TaxID=1974515 RepID=A0A2M6R9M6_9BACT|nr:MAG: 30S ribosomal protein S15 [Candidatus Berkelbacteria bacterium CG10_big_fil_rev_8_21_14_0_10_43_14]